MNVKVNISLILCRLGKYSDKNRVLLDIFLSFVSNI